jgi:uncharacterized membrane protein
MMLAMDENKHPDSDAALFTARITPQRSLSPRGVAMVLAFAALVSFTISLPFVLLGAWPIAGFFGIDVLLLWWAFRLQAKEARAYEEIVVSRPALTVRRVNAVGLAREARFNPAWVRLRRDVHAEFGVERLSLDEGRRSVEIARHLGRGEKGEFARALQSGIDAARRFDHG